MPKSRFHCGLLLTLALITPAALSCNFPSSDQIDNHSTETPTQESDDGKSGEKDPGESNSSLGVATAPQAVIERLNASNSIFRVSLSSWRATTDYLSPLFFGYRGFEIKHRWPIHRTWLSRVVAHADEAHAPPSQT